MRAFSSSVVPVSSTSGGSRRAPASAATDGRDRVRARRAGTRRPRSSTRRAARSPCVDEDLDDLASLVVVLRRQDERQRHRHAQRGARGLRDHLALRGDDLGDAGLGEPEQRVEVAAREREPFGGALHLDEALVAGHHDVHVDLGAHVLGVLEVEHRRAVDDTDRDRGARLQHRMLASAPAARSRLHASCSAIQPPQIDAVRVPPSACNTSQSTVSCTSGIEPQVGDRAQATDRSAAGSLACDRSACRARLRGRPARATNRAASSTRR